MKYPAIILERVRKTRQPLMDDVASSGQDSKLTPPKQKPEACLIDIVLITITINTITINDYFYPMLVTFCSPRFPFVLFSNVQTLR
jgi:hypothetical protein